MNNKFIDIETLGFKHDEHRITCISTCDEEDNMTTFSDESEEKMLNDFNDWCGKLPKDSVFWAKNGKLFDYPFIKARMKLYDIKWFITKTSLKEVDKFLPKNKKTGRTISLKDACEKYGFEGKLAEGIEAIFMWKYREWILIGTADYNEYEEKMWDELIAYCEHDARLVKQIWERFKK